MTLEQAKEELIKRYKYLYKNAPLILAPFMYEETKEEFQNRKKRMKEKYNFKCEYPFIGFDNIEFKKLYKILEEFLLSDKKIEETTLYQTLENKRNDKEFLEKVKHGLELVEKKNKRDSIIKTNLNIETILHSVCEYVDNQIKDTNNKNNKLKVLDEYFRLFRYDNTGRVIYGGRELLIKDMNNFIIVLPTTNINKSKLSRNKEDLGIRKNSFITAIAKGPHYDNNLSIFTEGEKQEVYLMFHDELPCDLEIDCKLEDEYFKSN